MLPNSSSMISTNPQLAHGLNYYLTRKALDNLTPNCLFARPCEQYDIPKQNGKTIQMFRYDLLANNTTPNAAEGQTGTGKSVSSRVINCSIAQYDDFLSWSDFHEATDIVNVAEEYSRLLSIQAATSNDVLIRNMFDADAASTAITLTGTNFSRKDISLIRTKLTGGNVMPRENGNFLMIIHPNFTYDLTNDPVAGGLMDVSKFTDPNKAGVFKLEWRGYVTTVQNVEVYESTNVYSSGGTFRGYAFGKGCAGIVKLAGMGPTIGVEDPQSKRFQINVVKGGVPTMFDPTGVHGGIVSYKYYFGACLLDGPAGIGGTYRYRTIDATTTVT
jgi:N4-gp56 family major capsid protein